MGHVTPAQIATIGDDDPVRLTDAPAVFFPFGGMTLSALRTERDKGNLVVERIAGKEFVTRRAINEMRARCRDPRSRHASNDARIASETDRHELSGSSATGSELSAQDALRIRLARPAKGCKPTSPKAGARTQAPVVPLRPSSATSS